MFSNQKPRFCQVDPFPRCRLRGWRLVDGLPTGCPLRAANALQAIGALQDRGFQQLAPGPGQDLTTGLADLERARICERCVSRLLPHPRVRKLRAALLARPSATLPPAAPRPAVAAPRHRRRTRRSREAVYVGR